ncbi:adenine DNA glycosylase [Ricinus communis]|uniref:adenine DNA glycosylase n=1 Tax=Ricinus communis TaxID=3988 RepID=UPI00201B157F|nr:adenine DNA glycosylase [Ricinus communis]
MCSLVKPRLRVRVFGRFEFSKPKVTPTPIILTRIPHFAPISAAMEDSRKLKNKKRNVQLISKEQEIVVDIEDIFIDKETQKIRESLLEWYDQNQRQLPWRRQKTTNPSQESEEEKEKRAYGIWVSEVMLQQTRVQTVIDYYNRWMLKWPTIHHLAQASLEEVNEIWAGLGYYRRARFLLEGAKMIVAGGGFPNTVSSLRKVPGIGDYTAGAIASIAFKEVVPVVDGNVVRVLTRLRAISANPKDSMTVKKLWKLAAQLVDPCRPGDFNQSLMELGATVCAPSNPSCSSCPVSSQCRVLSISNQDKSILVTDYPTKVVKVKPKHEFSAVCVVEILGSCGPVDNQKTDSKFLLVKRPDDGLLAGLWEFPTCRLDKEADLITRRNEIDHFMKKSFRLDPEKTYSMVLREDIGEFVHIFTHIRLKVYVDLLVIRLKGGMSQLFRKQEKEATNWKCVEKKALPNLGLTSGVRKVYTMVEKFKQQKLSTDSGPPRKRMSSRTRNH